jgi:peptide/nickel transport system permease protein
MSLGTGTHLGAGQAADRGPLPAPGAPPLRSRRLRLPRSPKVLIGLGGMIAFLVLAVIGQWIAPYNPSRTFSTTASFPLPPSAAHLLGTTQQQQDVFSQLLAGGRSTVLVAFVAGLVATVLSIAVGVTAGYLGGIADDLLSMLANFFLIMPALPLLVVIFGFIPSSQGSDDVLIGLIIAITGWAWGARVLRAQTLSLRSRDYVESARLIGERAWRIIGFEILPNLVAVVASSFLFTVLYGVGTYTALAFLGLVNPNHVSWGGMLFYAQVADAEQAGYWWLFIPPGLAVALLGTSLALLNFGIDEFINPRLRAAGLSRRIRRSGPAGARMPRRFVLGLTPVLRSVPAADDLAAAAGTGTTNGITAADGMAAHDLLVADRPGPGRRWRPGGSRGADGGRPR